MRRLSHASLNDSSKTKLTPTATANETRSPRGRARAKMLATVPKMRPTARLPNTRRSSNSVWSTWGRSKRRREAHRITKPGRIPRRNATRKSKFEAMEAVKKARALLKNAAGRLSSLTTGNAGLWSEGGVGLLFICKNCGGFVAGGDAKCPRCAAEFEAEPEPLGTEEDILDLVLCPTCGADNDPSLEECEVCGSTLRGTKDEPNPMAPEASPATPQTSTPRPVRRLLDNVDEFLRDLRPLVSEVPGPDAPRPAPAPKPSKATVKAPVAMPRPDPASTARKPESTPTPSPAVTVPSRPASPMPEQKPVTQTRPPPASELEARLAPRNKPAPPPSP